MRDYIGLIVIIIVMAGLLFGAAGFQACQEARVYNLIHQTQFNCGDFFWASDQINSQTQTVNLK